ncbi:hypothetical protein H8E88_13960 [candidate division KSB1 bacterium]|nr:hypothetical protein [candidate division KSB1 bacterium]MBL7093813.1 hypothetical protein [candidate division KSB1 bacterium]
MIALEWKTKLLPDGHLSVPPAIIKKLKLDSDSEVRILILREDVSLTKNDTPNPLLSIDNWAMDMGMDDLSEQHDHYLYGVPKK